MFAAWYLARRELERAEIHQRRAIELNPNDDRIVCQSGELATYRGRPREGVELVERAMRLNPFHPSGYLLHLGRALYHAGRHAEALDTLHGPADQSVRTLVYRLAAAERCGDDAARERASEALEAVAPGVTVDQVLRPLPYERARDADELADALRRAGLPDR